MTYNNISFLIGSTEGSFPCSLTEVSQSSRDEKIFKTQCKCMGKGSEGYFPYCYAVEEDSHRMSKGSSRTSYGFYPWSYNLHILSPWTGTVWVLLCHSALVHFSTSIWFTSKETLYGKWPRKRLPQDIPQNLHVPLNLASQSLRIYH